MKTFLVILIFFTFFNGCSSKNAFYEFKMDKERELAISSLKSSKIVSKSGEVSGIFSAIYLNDVYPETFNQDEVFFIFFFTKEEKKISDGSENKNGDLKVTLNSKMPIKVEKLSQDNRFSDLVDVKSSWNHYYIVTFEKAQKADLVFEDQNGSSNTLRFKKEF